MKWVLLVALVYGVSQVASDDDLDLDLSLPTVAPQYPQIPGLENLHINASSLPNPEEVERLFKEKCIRNGGENAYSSAKNARFDTEKCVKGLINFEELNREMEVAKPTGDLDEVFRKYCGKRHEFKKCIMNFVNATNLCLTEEERGSKQLVQNVTDQLMGFVCFKEGDRIALFIAESGPECLSDKKEAIVHCINATFGKHLPTGTPNIYDLPQLLVGAEECKDVCSLQRCVVKELEKCKEPTPANIVQSMFDYVLKVTPCSNCKAERLLSATASSNKIISGYLSLLLSVTVVSLTVN